MGSVKIINLPPTIGLTSAAQSASQFCSMNMVVFTGASKRRTVPDHVQKEGFSLGNEQIYDMIRQTRIVAIVRGLDGHFTELAQALYDGGIRAMEVTFRLGSPDEFYKTADSIHEIRAAMDDRMAVGAGTVTSQELVQLAHDAGAQFIVSPDTNIEVIRATKALGMLSMPGAMTPSEMRIAYDAGADFVKVFPAGVLGADYIKAIRGPLGHIPMLAVGGVGEKNVAEFIKAGCVGAGVGGKLVNKEWIEAGAWDKIVALARTLCENAQV